MRLLKEKTQDYIQVGLVSSISYKTLKRSILPLLLDELGLREEKLVDFVYLTEGDTLLKDDNLFTKTKQVLWILPIGTDEIEIKETIKQKGILRCPHERPYSLHPSSVNCRGASLETVFMYITNMAFQYEDSCSLQSLAKTIASLYFLGQISTTAASQSAVGSQPSPILGGKIHNPIVSQTQTSGFNLKSAV